MSDYQVNIWTTNYQNIMLLGINLEVNLPITVYVLGQGT